MPAHPIVRYMIVCNDWEPDPSNARRVNIYGLLTSIYSNEDPPYPLVYRELCVLALLTEGRGSGTFRITITYEETGEVTYTTVRWSITFGTDPLEVVGAPFRLENVVFPRQGIYAVQLWYNDSVLAECSLRLR